ncbi:hypothetical protein JGS39_29125 [Streptomyces sp. P01-B04]|uniref:hypothetical protein n=1 Tax=Streptomyces poriferorum TaxID=2798799 RepID=UPI001C605AB5|nr:hypothetical protein [Streptomyces poriferorum]MBW5252991.1 hypothetical protein [Streptomyces poriferorum]MBW5261097.1 hypothetical protein [Streptomyces poriferorum]
MTSTRRPLGTGPAMSPGSTSSPVASRLLPAERLAADAVERLPAPVQQARRLLGHGTAGAVSPGATGAGHDDSASRRVMPT